jgi:hypothetical protein
MRTANKVEVVVLISAYIIDTTASSIDLRGGLKLGEEGKNLSIHRV